MFQGQRTKFKNDSKIQNFASKYFTAYKYRTLVKIL